MGPSPNREWRFKAHHSYARNRKATAQEYGDVRGKPSAAKQSWLPYPISSVDVASVLSGRPPDPLEKGRAERGPSYHETASGGRASSWWQGEKGFWTDGKTEQIYPPGGVRELYRAWATRSENFGLGITWDGLTDWLAVLGRLQCLSGSILIQILRYNNHSTRNEFRLMF